MKILYVIPSTSTGGIENLIIQYGRYFKEKACDIDVLAFSEGRNVVFSEFSNVFFVKINRYSIISSYNAIKRFFATHKDYDVVHSSVHYYNGIIAKVAYNKGIKVRVSHVHTNGGACKNILSEYYNKVKNGFLRRLIIKYSTNCLACSYNSGNLMYGRDFPFEFFPNCIETNKYRYDTSVRKTLKIQFQIPESDIVILHVGRFSYEKNHKFLINVFSNYHRRNPNSKLLLLGEGPLRNEIEAYSKELDLSDSILFLGYKKDVYKFYSVADIFILPSLFEGFPVSVVEAQASGLLTYVSTKIPKEVIISDRVKRLSLSEDEKTWSNSLPEEINDEKREQYTDIVRSARFDIEDALMRLRTIYGI